MGLRPLHCENSTLESACQWETTTLEGGTATLGLRKYNPGICMSVKDYGPWTAKVRPWNLHVSERLRPWTVGLRPLDCKSTTLGSACQCVSERLRPCEVGLRPLDCQSTTLESACQCEITTLSPLWRNTKVFPKALKGPDL